MGRLSLKRILLATAIGIPLLALLVVWLERRPIAADVLNRELAKRHVRARYDVSAIGPRTQRLENIVIGDPRRPDLVAASATVVLGWWVTGPYVRTIAASGVRLRGRVLPDGTVSLGEVDKLMPASSGGPFTLPDLNVALDDATMRLDTPGGPIALSLQGSGNLQGGFSGHIGAVASQLDLAGCRLTQPTLFAAVSVQDREPLIDGPLRAARLTCPARKLDVSSAWIALKARLGPEFDRWTGNAGLALGAVTLGTNTITAVRGTIGFTGTKRHTEGDISLVTAAAAVVGANARGTRLAGRYSVDGSDAFGLRGQLRFTGLAIDAQALDALNTTARSLASTPLGPILTAWAAALGRAAASTDLTTDLSASSTPAGGKLQLDALNAQSASGARLALTTDGGLPYAWGGDARSSPFGATATLGGGGLPDLHASLRRVADGGAITGEVELTPYAVNGARIAATPVRIARVNGAIRVLTTVALDGPLASGRVAGLALPLDIRLGPGGTVQLNPQCAPLRFAALEISGARFARSSLSLCPVGPALYARGGGGGGRLVAPRLAGTVNGSPLTLDAQSIAFDTARGATTADALAIALGATEARTSLAIAKLTAAPSSKGLAGTFAGTAGRIGQVPLALTNGAGTWTFSGSRLSLNGGLQVADAAAPARFNPLVSRDTRLVLDGGTIRASGWLLEPRSGRRVTQVNLAHDLSSGVGRATLDVPDLAFDGGLQPEALTSLTLGVVAGVKGSVHGAGHIAWDARGVTSDGTFSTDDLALAAAFGPVSGIKGVIHFSDLLGMATPPHQEVTLGQVNPGIAVFGGKVRYQLLPGQLVKVESGEWPLSGGTLSLEPTLLDFGKPTTRRFSFAVRGMDAAKFIEQFKLDNVAATGTFDGELPMLFDDKGGRIVGGRVVARPPGGRLSYVGQISNEQLGTYGKLAFDALKSIRYQALAINLDGALDGEVVSRISFTGVNDKPNNVAPAKGIAKSFTNLPFKFNIVVRAPFRGLLNSASAFADPSALIKQQQAVQPQESGAPPSKP